MDKLVGVLEKIPTGVNTLGWLGVLLVLLHLGWRNRRETHNETTHLRQEMEAFTERLSTQNEKLMEQNDQLLNRVDKLEKENGELRHEVRGLQHVIDGLRRQAQSAQISAQRELIESFPLETVPPAMKKMLHNVVEDAAAKQEEQPE